ncbi:Gfo/Idh/MocA family oxidoreductase [Dehalococcoidia bacterium]|nr:Gfo/Idh/MocA family oxidoreductase [Dehalococcoidia bacterium]
MDSKTVRVCVVGAGRAGAVHAYNFCHNVQGAALTALVDVNTEAILKLGKDLGVQSCFSTLEEALSQAEFDAVSIATPTFTHASLVVAAAEEGKHVLCEKPIAMTLDEADQMIEATRKAKVFLQMGFMRRFDPIFATAKERIDAGVIGEPLMIRSLTRGPGLPPPWACQLSSSNGALAEVNSHDFDTIRWLSGSEFQRVYAEVGNLRSPQLKTMYPDFYDNAVVTFRMENGTLAMLDGSCPVGYGYDARAEVLGTRGVMLIGELQDKSILSCTKEQGVVSSNFPGWRERFRQGYLEEARHFVECITNGQRPKVTGEDGRKALEGVLAANCSIRTHQPVSLPLS